MRLFLEAGRTRACAGAAERLLQLEPREFLQSLRHISDARLPVFPALGSRCVSRYCVVNLLSERREAVRCVITGVAATHRMIGSCFAPFARHAPMICKKRISGIPRWRLYSFTRLRRAAILSGAVGAHESHAKRNRWDSKTAIQLAP